MNKELFIEQAISTLRNNPQSGANVIFHYEDAGARGIIPSWSSLTKPEEQLRKLISGPMNLPNKELVSADFELHEEQCGGWLILFFGSTGDEWEWLDGITETQAHFAATCDRRHLNYGHTGYAVIRCPIKPAPRTEAAINLARFTTETL